MTTNEIDKSNEIDKCKVLLDYVKFLSSISTGSILIIAAFVGKAVPTPEWQLLIGISLVAFLISVVLCLALFAMIAAHVDEAVNIYEGRADTISLYLNVAAILSFVIGMLSLVCWSIKNLV